MMPDSRAAALTELSWDAYSIPGVLYREPAVHQLSIDAGTPLRNGEPTRWVFHNETFYAGPPISVPDKRDPTGCFVKAGPWRNPMTDRPNAEPRHYADDVAVERRKHGPPARAAPVTPSRALAAAGRLASRREAYRALSNKRND